MNDTDRELIEETLRLSKENNRMLRSVKRSIFWGQVWSLVKIAIVVVPLVIGYLYLQPYLGSAGSTFQQAKDLLNQYK